MRKTPAGSAYQRNPTGTCGEETRGPPAESEPLQRNHHQVNLTYMLVLRGFLTLIYGQLLLIAENKLNKFHQMIQCE